MMLSHNGKNNDDGTFDWSNALIDSAISAGITFFSALGGTGAAQIPTRESLIVSGIAACTQFFIWLAIKRGLREKE